MDKVPTEHAFVDLSDYARPLARWLVRQLLPTPVTPIHLTLAFTLVGLAAAALFAVDRWLPLAGLLLLLKSTLDAADGSLARARRRPSRIGRFLDSVCDFIVMLAVFGGIACAAWSREGAWPVGLLAPAALVCATLQGSVFSYYTVRYRAQTEGDQTSQVDEAKAEGYAWDNPALLAGMHALYKIIYGWQDRLMDGIDRRVAAADAPLRPAFLTATTVLGLGTQLLTIAMCAAVGRPMVALWLFVTWFNVYWMVLILIRWITHGRTRPQAV
jgi:phosphatidylglycerophosphate synthase